MNIVGAPPGYIRWVPRNPENADCTIIALQLATGLTYEEVLAQALLIQPKVLTRGLHGTEMVRLASALGYQSRWVRKGRYTLESDTGILSVSNKRKPKGSTDHAVYLWGGRVIEPATESMWFVPQDYLMHERWEAGPLMVLTKEGA